MTDVFVFGSNLAGRHGKGAALYVRQHYGAVYGQGIGIQRTANGKPSRGVLGYSYAIPTKDESLYTLPLDVIERYIHQFLEYAVECSVHNPALVFQVTPVGCGLAGYSPEDIAPLFFNCWEDGDYRPWLPDNVILPAEFLALKS